MFPTESLTETKTKPRHIHAHPDETERESDILQATTDLETVFLSWQEEPGIDSPTWKFYEAAINLLKVWERGSPPLKYLAQLAKAEYFFEMLIRHFDKYGDKFTQPMPSREFFNALNDYFEGVREDVRSNDRPPLESAHDLHKQGVPHDQIVRMLGCTHLQLASELQGEPGNTLGPDWVSPVAKKAEEDRRALSLAEIAKASTGIVLRTCSARIRAYELAGLFDND